jgi:hypothetical protein
MYVDPRDESVVLLVLIEARAVLIIGRAVRSVVPESGRFAANPISNHQQLWPT